MTPSAFFRHALAEWRPAAVLVRRTRLGLWLAAIVACGIALAGPPTLLLPGLSLAVALTAAVTAAHALAGREAGRASALTLRHPASPVALAVGRWLLVALIAAAVTALVSLPAAWRLGLAWGDGARATAVAGCAALPVAACALAAARLGRGVLEWLFLAHLLLVSSIVPGTLRLLPGGVLRDLTRAALVTLPAVWRYRLLAGGDGVAWLHALSWTAAGLLVTAESLRRRSP